MFSSVVRLACCVSFSFTHAVHLLVCLFSTRRGANTHKKNEISASIAIPSSDLVITSSHTCLQMTSLTYKGRGGLVSFFLFLMIYLWQRRRLQISAQNGQINFEILASKWQWSSCYFCSSIIRFEILTIMWGINGVDHIQSNDKCRCSTYWMLKQDTNTTVTSKTWKKYWEENGRRSEMVDLELETAVKRLLRRLGISALPSSVPKSIYKLVSEYCLVAQHLKHDYAFPNFDFSLLAPPATFAFKKWKKYEQPDEFQIKTRDICYILCDNFCI